MSRSSRAGVASLLAAPIIAAVSVLVSPTLSDDAGKQLAALTDHRAAVIAGLTLNTIALALLIAGIVWLALVLARHAPTLASAGGILGVGGLLIVLFENGISAAAPSLSRGLDPAQATAALGRIHSSVAVSRIEPFSLLGDIGFVLLGIAVVKAGAPRWTAAAIAAGALGEGAGFATATKPLTVVAFAVLFLGLLAAVRTLLPRPGRQVTAEAALTS
jgi:hypothetical protein